MREYNNPSMRVPLTLLALVLFSGVLGAWQLTPKSLSERVNDATVIVVAKVAVTYERKPSAIAGVGDAWEVGLQVSRTLKGSMPSGARVTFVDVAVQERNAFRPSEQRVWLLKSTTDARLLSASAGYESVLALSEEPRVAALLGARAAPQLR